MHPFIFGDFNYDFLDPVHKWQTELMEGLTGLGYSQKSRVTNLGGVQNDQVWTLDWDAITVGPVTTLHLLTKKDHTAIEGIIRS